jgi:hypothetical protein
MRKKRRQEHEANHAELLSREVGWLEASSRKGGEIRFGAPMKCPQAECGDFGLVETVTPGRQHNRCWSCGTVWSLSLKAMALFAQACKAPDPTTIVGAGTLVADLEAPSAARTTRERFVGVRSVLQRDTPVPGAIQYLPNS